MSDKIKVVAIAIYSVTEDRYLILRRKMEDSGGGVWEFPGGKVEPGESDEQSLQREIWEELQFQVDLFRLVFIGANPYTYPNRTIDLHLFKYSVETEFEPALIDHDAFVWVKKDQILSYNFSQADVYFLNLI
jgi:8-oxo-dGTP diphosphatase